MAGPATAAYSSHSQHEALPADGGGKVAALQAPCSGDWECFAQDDEDDRVDGSSSSARQTQSSSSVVSPRSTSGAGVRPMTEQPFWVGRRRSAPELYIRLVSPTGAMPSGFSIVVKNTFLDVVDDTGREAESPQRLRRMSEPAVATNRVLFGPEKAVLAAAVLAAALSRPPGAGYAARSRSLSSSAMSDDSSHLDSDSDPSDDSYRCRQRRSAYGRNGRGCRSPPAAAQRGRVSQRGSFGGEPARRLNTQASVADQASQACIEEAVWYEAERYSRRHSDSPNSRKPSEMNVRPRRKSDVAFVLGGASPSAEPASKAPGATFGADPGSATPSAAAGAATPGLAPLPVRQMPAFFPPRAPKPAAAAVVPAGRLSDAGTTAAGAGPEVAVAPATVVPSAKAAGTPALAAPGGAAAQHSPAGPRAVGSVVREAHAGQGRPSGVLPVGPVAAGGPIREDARSAGPPPAGCAGANRGGVGARGAAVPPGPGPVPAAQQPFAPAARARGGIAQDARNAPALAAPLNLSHAGNRGPRILPMAVGPVRQDTALRGCAAGAVGVPAGADLGPQETRTTVMLQNVPFCYSRDALLAFLDAEGFAAMYDFLYLPMNFGSGCNFGYAFINMVVPSEARRFWVDFEGFTRWPNLEEGCGDKPGEVFWSCPHQGVEMNVSRYRNSPLMHKDVLDAYKPVVLVRGVRVPFPPPTKAVPVPRVRPSRKRRDEPAEVSASPSP